MSENKVGYVPMSSVMEDVLKAREGGTTVQDARDAVEKRKIVNLREKVKSLEKTNEMLQRELKHYEQIEEVNYELRKENTWLKARIAQLEGAAKEKSPVELAL